jgi:hypothetical protein
MPRLESLSLNDSTTLSSSASASAVTVTVAVPAATTTSSVADDDIYSLDEEGWRRVATSGGIEELLKLGEGVSGSVCKCRLRASGQIFAIKV